MGRQPNCRGIIWYISVMMGPEYHKKRRRERRKKMLMLLGGRCESCGTRNNLEFDHKNRKKKQFHISDFNRAEDSLHEEAKNCRILCRPCHEQKSRDLWEYTHPEAKHGTLWRYKHYKCRCNKCRQAMSDYYLNRK